MKLLRYGNAGHERPAVLLQSGSIVDVGEVTPDFDQSFFQDNGIARLHHALTSDRDELPHAKPFQRLGPPIAKPYQALCVGLNYVDHVAESGATAPAEPVVFNKGPRTIVGPNDDVIIPKGSAKTDWEIELGVVIGHEAHYLADEEEGWACVAGYAISNDVSEREFQLERGGQWVKGKSCETFNPLGPWLVTPDEVGDVTDLDMSLRLNGEPVQQSSTAMMIFSVGYIVWYLSQFMILEPGDLLNTGTPPGVGLGMKPPRYLGPGDELQLSISGLGSQHQRARAA